MNKQLDIVYRVCYDYERFDGTIVTKTSQAFSTEELAEEYKFYLDKIPYVISSYVSPFIRV